MDESGRDFLLNGEKNGTIKAMLTLDEQQEKYAALWGKYSPLFGTEIFEDDPVPLYNIGTSLPSKWNKEMVGLSKHVQKITGAIGDWLTPKRLHITLDIPGRLGVHLLYWKAFRHKSAIPR